ncbi:MAG: M23 family metallopeptidase [bacterium]
MQLKKPSKHDKIRLIFFSTGDSEIRHFEINLQRLFLMLLFTSIVIGSLFMASVTISNSLHKRNSDGNLEESNTFMQKQVGQLQDNIDSLNYKLQALEENTEDLEVLVGLTSTTMDSDLVLKSLQNEDNMVLSSLPVDYDYETDKMRAYLTSLESRIKKAEDIQGVIEDKFLQTQTEIEHIPSIRPVQGARITDKFGIRKDPFVERVKHHNGIDLTARYGTKVYAAASGVVEFTRMRYRLNKGYGRVIIINHGYGYKTLYGHLSKIFVKRGQKVKRWDNIGLSGNTGRATGPHLHYEVWRNGRPQNPEQFILN